MDIGGGVSDQEGGDGRRRGEGTRGDVRRVPLAPRPPKILRPRGEVQHRLRVVPSKGLISVVGYLGTGCLQ